MNRRHPIFSPVLTALRAARATWIALAVLFVARWATAQESLPQPFPFGLPEWQSLETPGPMGAIKPKRAPGPVALESYLIPLDGGGDADSASGVRAEPIFRSASVRRNEQDDAEEVELRERGARRVPLADQTEVVVQRYPDGKVQIERQVAQDAEGNYYNHGPWKLYSPSGQIVAEGVFQFGLMEGTWQRWHAGGEQTIFQLPPFNQFRPPFLSHGTFRRGRLHGVWVIHDQQQRKVMEMSFRDGQRHGVATWWYPNGTRMRETTFHQGLLDGPFQEWNEQSQVVRTEEYIRGRKVVKETSNYPSGKKLIESFFLDPILELEREDNWWDASPSPFLSRGERQQHGPISVWYENGQPLMQGQFADGLRQGTFVWFHPNGQRQLMGQYREGEQVGEWVWWHENGLKAAQGSYDGSHPVGSWTWWNPDGQVADRQAYSLEVHPRQMLSPPKEEALPEPNKRIPEIDLEELEGLDRDLKIEGSLPPDGPPARGDQGSA